jgi:hypothetical protein
MFRTGPLHEHREIPMTVASMFGQLVPNSTTPLERARTPEGERAAQGRGSMNRLSERLARQPELSTAREVAGLSDTELAALATEFTLSPKRRRTDLMRFASPFGALVFGVGLAGLMLQDASLGAAGRGVLSAFELICLGSLVVGLVAVALGTMKAFSLTSVDLAYGHLGHYVGVLDEQHPWLYKTYLLMRNDAARAYRDRVLQQRGALRGVDCVLMREIARADEERVMTLTARDVATQVQALPAAGAAPRGAAGEPRLVLVDSAVSAA